jgi:hypothetical protein
LQSKKLCKVEHGIEERFEENEKKKKSWNFFWSVDRRKRKKFDLQTAREKTRQHNKGQTTHISTKVRMGLHEAIAVQEFSIYGFKCRGVFAQARIAKGERVWWLVAGEEASSVVMTRAEILSHPESATLQTYSYMIGTEKKKKKNHYFFFFFSFFALQFCDFFLFFCCVWWLVGCVVYGLIECRSIDCSENGKKNRKGLFFFFFFFFFFRSARSHSTHTLTRLQKVWTSTSQR